jgi:hypothetical protein
MAKRMPIYCWRVQISQVTARAADGSSLLVSAMSESTAKRKSSGSAWDYYRPYVVEISNRNFVEPFCY